MRKVCTYENSPDDIPLERTGATATVIEDNLYLFGGYSDEGNLNTLHRLNLKTLKWCQLQPTGRQPIACDKSACWEFDGKFYLFGGYGRAPNPRDWLPNTHLAFTYDNVSPWVCA